MKQKFTTQKSANRGPAKRNFSFIEVMPTWRRRAEGYSRQEDSDRHDKVIKLREDKKNGKAVYEEVEILRPYGYNTKKTEK